MDDQKIVHRPVGEQPAVQPHLQTIEAHEEKPVDIPSENVVYHPAEDEASTRPALETNTIYIDLVFSPELPGYTGEGIVDTPEIETLCSEGGAFDWLNDPEEKTYSPDDGKPA